MTNKILLGTLGALLLFFSCSESSKNSNADPFATPQTKEEVVVEEETPEEVSDIEQELGEIDDLLAEKGKTLFNAKCLVCHAMDKKLIGPPLAGVSKKRSAEWILKMILDPTEMLKNDPEAKKLLKEYNNIPMAPLGLNDAEARSILEYFRKTDS